MDLNSQEQKSGVRWFFGAGLVAVCLSLFLYNVDNILTFSDKEERLAETLYDLRSAQTGLPTGSVDDRLLVGSNSIASDQVPSED